MFRPLAQYSIRLKPVLCFASYLQLKLEAIYQQKSQKPDRFAESLPQAEHVAAHGMILVVAPVCAVALPPALFLQGCEPYDIASVSQIQFIHRFDQAMAPFEIGLFEEPIRYRPSGCQISQND